MHDIKNIVSPPEGLICAYPCFPEASSQNSKMSQCTFFDLSLGRCTNASVARTVWYTLLLLFCSGLEQIKKGTEKK